MLRAEAMLDLRQPGGRKDPGLVLMAFSSAHPGPSSPPCTLNIEMLEMKGRQGKAPALGFPVYWGSHTRKPVVVIPYGVNKSWVNAALTPPDWILM